MNYPPGAANDPKAPYNEPCQLSATVRCDYCRNVYETHELPIFYYEPANEFICKSCLPDYKRHEIESRVTEEEFERNLELMT